MKTIYKTQPVKEETKLVVVYKQLDSLYPNPKNARTHSRRQRRQIARSIRKFGFVNPIIIDANNYIIAGHGRVEAAKLLGITEVPTIRLEHLTPDQLRAYVIAENRIAENSGWNHQILAIEFQYLMSLDCIDFDVTDTGFEIPEIDVILEEVQGAVPPEDEAATIDPSQRAVSRIGDLWVLDKHHIFCGNSLRESSYQILMGDKRATAVFSDAPYNCPIDGHVTGNGTVQHREFAMASGEMTRAEFTSFLATALQLLVQYTAENSVHYLCMDFRNVDTLLAVGRQQYGAFLNLCVWVKDNGGMLLPF